MLKTEQIKYSGIKNFGVAINAAYLEKEDNPDFKTLHKIQFSDSKNMSEINSESIDLIVTSPPYPMIQMWDDLFSKQNPEIKNALDAGAGDIAFELMHKELDGVWKESFRVLKNGGIVCINIGDATRSIGKKFQIYPNHARIMNYCLSIGFHFLPEILWIKETNKPDKFMGSGMLPVGAYVTLEHEHILILRKNGKREFKTPDESLNRQKSAFFWEERNLWFSDKWRDINGVFQKMNNEKTRERSAAFPFELSYRLINMFSVYGDTVLDPFLGTGTTTISSIASGRNSVGYEMDSAFKDTIYSNINNCLVSCNSFVDLRLKNHIDFILKREFEKGKVNYENKNYKLPVMTNQEKNLILPKIKNIQQKNGNFTAEHSHQLT